MGLAAVARMLLRRLVGPLTLWDAADPESAFIEWETLLKPGILEGLAPLHLVASLTGLEELWCGAGDHELNVTHSLHLVATPVF